MDITGSFTFRCGFVGSILRGEVEHPSVRLQCD